MRLVFYFIFFANFSLLGVNQDSNLGGFDKKVNKLLKDVFDEKDGFLIKEISFPNVRTTVPGRNLFALSHEDDSLGYLVINKAHGCLIGGCNAGNYEPNAKYEDFLYAVIYDSNFEILRVKVLDYESEYGYEICAKSWLKQFKGFQGCELEYGSKQVDAISGATVSARSIVADINNLCWLLKE